MCEGDNPLPPLEGREAGTVGTRAFLRMIRLVKIPSHRTAVGIHGHDFGWFLRKAKIVLIRIRETIRHQPPLVVAA